MVEQTFSITESGGIRLTARDENGDTRSVEFRVNDGGAVDILSEVPDGSVSKATIDLPRNINDTV